MIVKAKCFMQTIKYFKMLRAISQFIAQSPSWEWLFKHLALLRQC